MTRTFYTNIDSNGDLTGEAFFAVPQPGRAEQPITEDDPRYIRANDPLPTLEDVLTRIDQAAEAARLQHITAGDGQALTYEAKRQEVIGWFFEQARPAAASEFPFLYAEAEARSQSVDAVATEIWINAGLWGSIIGPAIEKARTAAKDAARADGADLQQVLSDALAALDTAANPTTHSTALGAMQTARETEAVSNARGE